MSEESLFSPEVVTIYSVGLLGGSLGLALKTSGFPGTIIGLSSPAAIDTARRLGCIDEGYGYDSLPDVVRRTNLLILCSPIGVIMKTLRHLAGLDLREGMVITDVGSTKREILAAAGALPDRVHFVGGHPMAGSEKHGPSASDPYLFQNALYILAPDSPVPSARDRALGAFLETWLGCRHAFLTPETHDTIAATVSHVPHLLAVALVNVAQEIDDSVPGALSFAAGGFRDLTRIASSPYRMWRDIFRTNRTRIEPVLDRCVDTLRRMKAGLAGDDLGEAFDRAARTRASLPSHKKGFITPLSEVLVVTKDQPGIIAALATSLADKGINIKDIEVLKVREGEGGTIRLAFDSRQTAGEAVKVLTNHGFSARER